MATEARLVRLFAILPSMTGLFKERAAAKNAAYNDDGPTATEANGILAENAKKAGYIHACIFGVVLLSHCQCLACLCVSSR